MRVGIVGGVVGLLLLWVGMGVLVCCLMLLMFLFDLIV